jgi:hypothetical protein
VYGCDEDDAEVDFAVGLGLLRSGSNRLAPEFLPIDGAPVPEVLGTGFVTPLPAIG